MGTCPPVPHGIHTPDIAVESLITARRIVNFCVFVSRMREALERLHEHMRKDIKTDARCQSTRLTRPIREKVTSNSF